MGKNTQTVVSVEEVIAAATCFAPETAACTAEAPLLRSRYTFSITTMELSTSIPTATARPESEIMLSVTPEKYISTNANTTLMGIEQRVMNVGRMSLKNRNRITIANTAPHSRLERMESVIK